MKKFMQKILQLVVVAAVMLPSVSNAEEETTFADVMQVGGWTAFAGGVAYYVALGDPPACTPSITIPGSGGGFGGPFIPPTIIPGNCLSYDAHVKDQGTAISIGAVGLLVALLGHGLEAYGDANPNFQVRPTLGGVEIERKGISFSANVNGQAKLQKRLGVLIKV